MTKHPIFYTKSDFFDMPSNNAQEANDYLIRMAQTRFAQVFEAKVIAKLSSVAERCDSIDDYLVSAGVDAVFSHHISNINKSIENLASEMVYDHSFQMRVAQKQILLGIESELTALSDAAQDAVDNSNNQLSYVNDDKLKLAVLIVKKACLFINSIPDDLSNYSQFPATKSYDEISNTIDNYQSYWDENKCSTTETRSRTVQIGQVKVSLEVEKCVGEMGEVMYQERWAVDDKPLRSGQLPYLVEVYRNPSAEDNDPSFRASSDIALLEEDYRHEHQLHVSRELACQYIGSESDDYKEIMAAMEKEISSQVGNAAMANNTEKNLAQKFGR